MEGVKGQGQRGRSDGESERTRVKGKVKRPWALKVTCDIPVLGMAKRQQGGAKGCLSEGSDGEDRRK